MSNTHFAHNHHALRAAKRTQEAKRFSDAELVFIGDSITEGCGTCRRGGCTTDKGPDVVRRLHFPSLAPPYTPPPSRPSATAGLAMISPVRLDIHSQIIPSWDVAGLGEKPRVPWLAELAHFHPVALGISGDRTDNVIYRVSRGVR